ncbi:MAG: ATP-binding protein [Marinilabiliaceae bacterium]|nr:ATP-binding protein [Marinilabiliaceae bacterium]
MDNPFILEPYVCKELFCDREKEVKNLLSNCKNGINTTLISNRRLGKTGLIMRLFDEINQKKLSIFPIYADIYATKNLSDFIKCLTEAILDKYPQKTSFGNRFFKFIKSFRPVFSFDPITGSTQIEINYHSPNEKEQTLRSIFAFLEQQKTKILIAIDEFQQIREYPEKNVEAILRTHIQHLKNIRFIFCGSKKHIMFDIFSNAKNPFYSSTQFLKLGVIQKEKYRHFINSLFEKNKRKIETDALNFILEWTKQHTYYTQALCNQVFAAGTKKIAMQEVKRACKNIFLIYENIFFQYRALLTDNQWKFLIAVAKEKELHKFTASEFLNKHNIGTPANAKRALTALTDKELLCEHDSKEGKYYTVYDVFLARWLENEY